MAKNELTELLDDLFHVAQMQFGSAVKSRWLHDGDGCPGCGKEIGATKYKKKKMLSLNSFFYREHSVVIFYMLCGKCANHIIAESKIDPHGKLPIHDEIEKRLKQAFVKHLGH